MLYDMALSLQQTNFANKEEAHISLGKLQRVLDVIDEHTENEDNFILPAIQQYEPSLTDAFVQKHAEGHQLAEKLRKSVAVYYRLIMEEERINSGAGINKTFTEYMEANIGYMSTEETVLNKVLWRYYSDSEIMILNQRTTNAQSTEQNSFPNWMVRGLSNEQIVGLMKAVGQNAPDYVFNSLLAIAEKELPGIRYTKVIEGLTNGVMVA
jgi:hypothetical protein